MDLRLGSYAVAIEHLTEPAAQPATEHEAATAARVLLRQRPGNAGYPHGWTPPAVAGLDRVDLVDTAFRLAGLERWVTG